MIKKSKRELKRFSDFKGFVNRLHEDMFFRYLNPETCEWEKLSALFYSEHITLENFLNGRIVNELQTEN